jgi:hypothetical protein
MLGRGFPLRAFLFELFQISGAPTGLPLFDRDLSTLFELGVESAAGRAISSLGAPDEQPSARALRAEAEANESSGGQT